MRSSSSFTFHLNYPIHSHNKNRDDKKMVQFLNREHIYQHPWERVTTAFWRKYPNPLSPHVLDIDVLDRHLDAKGRLYTTRLITCKGHVPDWISKAVGGKNHCFVLERSVVDRENRTLVMKSRNISFENLIQVHETCVYDTHTGEEGTTRFTQQAKIVVPVWGFSERVENLTLDNFHKNAKKGLEAMENICQAIAKDIKQETIDFLKKKEGNVSTEANACTAATAQQQ